MSKNTARRSRAAAFLAALITPLALLIAFMASLSYTSLVNAAGALTVEIIAGYNLVVDSNVSAPSTAAPSVATVIGRVCNTSAAPVNNVSVSIGDYAHNTPGIYPVRDSATFSDTNPLHDTGSYAFTHIGGTADATRIIPTLGASGTANSCAVEYWHFTYPRCVNGDGGVPMNPPCTNGAVWGDSVKPGDDLWLTFDVWAREPDGSVATDTWKMTMRNEISAMANKIEPNPLGMWFNTESDTVQAGGFITTNGILYELGRINQGFDNNGDLVYDYNAWLQPIGDPSFDPTCFRLVRTTGVLTVSRSGTSLASIIPFTDTLYFTDLPPDNTGVRGLVFYTFMALRGSCGTAVSPYQEVASGADNEKFNGDYGGAVPPPPKSTPPEVSLDKSGNITVTAGSRITYTVSLSNVGPNSAGNPSVGMPLVLSDTIPASTTFTGYTNTTTTSVTILYSTDHGQTYAITQPIPASAVTNVQWWLTSPLAAGASMAITFSVEVNSAFPPAGADPYINNCADVSFGGTTPFAEDCAPTMVAGSYRIGDRVWQDEDLDRVQDTGEVSISNISLYLYFDKDRDGALDSSDPQIMATTTSITGWYDFSGLAAGSYLVVVDNYDPKLPPGYRNTTPVISPTALSSTKTSDLDADFGFGPSLDVTKTASYDGQYVRYSIPVANQRPGGGEPVGNGCRYTVWASTPDDAHSGTGNKAWLSPQNAYIPPGPDYKYATAPFANAGETLGVSGFSLTPKPGNITAVEIYLPLQVYSTLIGDFTVNAIANGTLLAAHTYNAPDLTTTLTVNVTSDRSWQWTDFSTGILGAQLLSSKQGTVPGHLNVDAVAYRITSSAPCQTGNALDTITGAPLTDTYDTSRLQFVSAVPPQSDINESTGVITWTNVGPIDPGQTANVQVTFLAVPRTAPFSVTNTACVTGATFSDGQPTNNDCGSVTRRFTPTGIISGVVWARNGSTTDWYDATGYRPTDWRIPNVAVTLYVCVLRADNSIVYPSDSSKTCDAQTGGNKGVFTPTASLLTDQNGAYTFTNLLYGFYYVAVDSASLPAGYVEAANPVYPGNGAGVWCLTTPANCTNQWLTPTINLRTDAYYFNPIGNGAGGAGDSYSEVISNVNFGYSNTLAAVYGTIWEDHDRDGHQDSGDQGLDNGIAGITVTLRNLAGTPVYTVQTNATGYYIFNNVAPGSYTVTVVTGTMPGGGSAWELTYDADDLICVPSVAGCDSAHTINNLLAGQVSGPHNFGYYHGGTYEIGDRVYVDWNGNGTQDPGEEGLFNIPVSLYADSNNDGSFSLGQDALIATTTTYTNGNDSGYYLFTGLVTGTYFVTVDTSRLPAWWDDYRETQDPDESGLCTICNSRGKATLSSTFTSILTVDFGYQPVGFSTIGDYVWHDANLDGFQGANEVGITGAVVELYEDGNRSGTIDPDDALVMTKTTNSAGYYLFSNLLTNLQSMTGIHGEYLVRVVTSTVTTDTYGNPYALTTHYNPISVSLSVSENYLDADFGFAAGATVGDRIWEDVDGDGIQDQSEPGISGVTVRLYYDSNGDGITDTFVITQTGADGIYHFYGLPVGNYSVAVVTSTLPAGLASQTGDPDISRLNPCSVACDSQSSFNLLAGQQDLSRDFGYRPLLYIGDRVWLNTDGDGDDIGEPGIPGVVITLTNQTGGVVTTTTDTDGYYSFGGLIGGQTYTVAVSAGTLPSGVVANYEYNNLLSQGGDPNGVITVTTGVDSVTFIGDHACTGCAMDVDFGYAYAPGNYSISGVTFHDYDDDAGSSGNPHLDAGDAVYPHVLVYLAMQVGGSSGPFTIIGSMWTDASGAYTFTNLAEGYYKVSTSPVAPDGEGITTNSMITPPGEPGIHLYDDPAHRTSSGNDFGFYGDPRPTAIILASFVAQSRNGVVVVEWKTATEIDNSGFNLYRTDAADVLPGPEQRLNAGLIESPDPGALEGNSYAYPDETADPDGTYYYWLEARDNKGVSKLYGPISITTGVVGGTPGPNAVYLPIVIKSAE